VLLSESHFYSSLEYFLIVKNYRTQYVVVQAWNPSTWDAEATELRIQSQPGQHSKFKANLAYIAKPYLKNEKKKTLKIWVPIFLENHNKSEYVSSV
jgi:hypothetical protein